MPGLLAGVRSYMEFPHLNRQVNVSDITHVHSVADAHGGGEGAHSTNLSVYLWVTTALLSLRGMFVCCSQAGRSLLYKLPGDAAC